MIGSVPAALAAFNRLINNARDGRLNRPGQIRLLGAPVDYTDIGEVVLRAAAAFEQASPPEQDGWVLVLIAVQDALDGVPVLPHLERAERAGPVRRARRASVKSTAAFTGNSPKRSALRPV